MSLESDILNFGGDAYDKIWVNYKTLQVYSSRRTDFKKIANNFPLSQDQKNQIDLLYKQNFGKKIPYCWHQYFAAHSGVFTPEYFPDYLLHSKFEHYMNSNVHYAFAFEDKNILPYIASAAGVSMPKTILSGSYGVLRDWNNTTVSLGQAVDILLKAGRVFCKPAIDSCGGRGCRVIDFSTMSDNESVMDTIKGLGDNFVIQELLHCHPSISAMYPNSVNTFRVITYRWQNNFYHMPVFMRIGRGGAVVDNGASGGLFIGVHDDGSLTDYAVAHNEVCIPSHPDTGYIFKNSSIPNFSMVIESALKMHSMIPEVGLVYWDFTINVSGSPVLIECNILNGTVYAIQMTHGVGPFGERTPEVLSWIRKMDSTPASRRHKYAFGKM